MPEPVDTPGSVWRAPGMAALLATSALGFAGFALLLPTAPLWARQVGADEGGAGLVNAVLMCATVLVQSIIPWALRTVGWRVTLSIGMVLLGLPSLLFVFTDALWGILAISALRGAGFAALTVCGASAVAHLVPSTHRGRAVGVYGLSIAVPQFLLTPTSAWIAQTVDFRLVFVLGCLPVLAVPFALALGGRIDRHAGDDDGAEGSGSGGRRAYLALALPALVLLAITTPGGAIISFAPQLGFASLAVVLSLFGLTGVAAFSRWIAGGLADHYGPHRFIAPLLATGAVGLVLVAWAVTDPDGSAVLLVAGTMIVGIAYGSLQNLTLVISFAAVPTRMRDVASTTWNIGFDTGTGLGSLVVGFIAAGTSFAVGFSVTASFCVVVAALYLIRLGLLRRRALDQPPAF
ncbi:MAG: MFS transporter [Candidatus Microbacterium stercoravium]